MNDVINTINIVIAQNKQLGLHHCKYDIKNINSRLLPKIRSYYLQKEYTFYIEAGGEIIITWPFDLR